MLHPGLRGGVAGVVHNLWDLSRLAPSGDAIDAAIGAIRKTLVGFAELRLERLYVRPRQVEPGQIVLDVEQR